MQSGLSLSHEKMGDASVLRQQKQATWIMDHGTRFSPSQLHGSSV
ncbi:MAG: hypothetical protein RIM23_23265 [Coleofasciculus sp. G3-WIS-01]